MQLTRKGNKLKTNSNRINFDSPKVVDNRSQRQAPNVFKIEVRIKTSKVGTIDRVKFNLYKSKLQLIEKKRSFKLIFRHTVI